MKQKNSYLKNDERTELNLKIELVFEINFIFNFKKTNTPYI